MNKIKLKGEPKKQRARSKRLPQDGRSTNQRVKGNIKKNCGAAQGKGLAMQRAISRFRSY